MLRIVLLFFVCSVAYGQQVYEGTVVNKETGKPVPFASIAVIGTTKGTSSNQNGQFSISIAEEEFTLNISCIGFESVRITNKKDLLRIELVPTTTQLEGIVISNKPIDPKKIVQKAFDNIRINTNQHPFLQSYFYRHYCQDNDVYGRLIEAYFDVWKNQGYRIRQQTAGESEEFRVTQLRRSMDKTSVSQGHDPISIGDILETDIVGYQSQTLGLPFSIYRNVSDLMINQQLYKFSFTGISSYNNEDVYEVTYLYRDTVPTLNQKYRVRGEISGTLFITTDKHAIVKRVENKRSGNNSIFVSTFYREIAGYYYPYHFIFEGHDLTQNKKESHFYHIELMLSEVKLNKDLKFKGAMLNRAQLLQAPYDSIFWTTNTILKTTPLESEIISDLGGGVSLNKQFQLYKEFEKNTNNGGENAEDKIRWVIANAKGNRPVYIMFWSDNARAHQQEFDQLKQLQKNYRNALSVMLISVSDDNVKWNEQLVKYNLFADGIMNYRINKQSQFPDQFAITALPAYVLINKEGSVQTNIKPPVNPVDFHFIDLE